MTPIKRIFARLLAAQAAGNPSLVMLPESDKESRATGAQQFFTGRSCRRGHFAARRADNRLCTECGRESSRDRWHTNKHDPDWKEHQYVLNRKYLAKDRERRPEYWRARARARDAQKLGATPPWLTQAHQDETRAIYADAAARSEPHHVDHIIPLVHPDVCGLHVPWNLQVLSAADNLRKSNSFDGTMENDGWRG